MHSRKMKFWRGITAVDDLSTVSGMSGLVMMTISTWNSNGWPRTSDINDPAYPRPEFPDTSSEFHGHERGEHV